MTAQHYALIGYPLGHSVSPLLHQRLFALTGDQASDYRLLEVSPNNLEAEMPRLLQLDGFNVTIPHKLNIIRYLDKLDITAKRYGAVNVVKCGEQNIGYNTDVEGFRRSIGSIGAELNGRVLLLGCGGAGRMMALEAALSGAELTIAVRESSYEKAENVAHNIKTLQPESKVRVVPVKMLSGAYDLLINATPCGMYPHADEMPISPDLLDGLHFCFDAIYNPTETQLVRAAKKAGAKAVGGMTMLVWQAVAAHEIWRGVSFDPSAVIALIQELEQAVAEQFGGDRE